MKRYISNMMFDYRNMKFRFCNLKFLSDNFIENPNKYSFAVRGLY